MMKKNLILSLFLAYASLCTYAQDASSLLGVGSSAPDFALATPEGDTLALSDFHGKYVLMDFWASWCPDCRRANPEMVRLYKRFRDKNVVFLGVSFDKNRESWQKAIAKDSLTWAHVSELKPWKETAVSSLYGIQWIPTVYLISPEGTVLYASISGEGLEQKLSEVLP